MRQDITPIQVMIEAVDYSHEDFLKNLWKIVKSRVSREKFNHIPEREERDRKYDEALREVFNFIYEICYLAAARKPHLEMMLKRSNEGERKIIEKTIKENKGNIDMLHAILIKHMKRGLNKGLTRKQAAKSAIDYSKEVFFKWNKEKKPWG
jgi:hypothetical protein